MPDPRPTRARWVATATVLAMTAILAVGLHVRGLASRRWYRPAGVRDAATTWVGVEDGGAAYLLWREAGVSGRRLLLLTGRWATVPLGDVDPAPLSSRTPPSPDNVLLLAARDGIIREIDVVMPPGPFGERRAEAARAKTFSAGEGWFRQDFHGFARRFALPSAVLPSSEQVLVLVEPSFFQDGAPVDPAAWLREKGVSADLAVLALSDPAAAPPQLEAAAALARDGASP
jgi:hypothetical protein